MRRTTVTTIQLENYPVKNYSPLLQVVVRGTPIGQGSIRSLGKGRPSVHANAATLLPWRTDMQLAIETAMCNGDPAIVWPVTGPVEVTLAFTMRKPTTAPKRKRTWPVVRPDLDHLVRAALDALTN